MKGQEAEKTAIEHYVRTFYTTPSTMVRVSIGRLLAGGHGSTSYCRKDNRSGDKGRSGSVPRTGTRTGCALVHMRPP